MSHKPNYEKVMRKAFDAGWEGGWEGGNADPIFVQQKKEVAFKAFMRSLSSTKA